MAVVVEALTDHVLLLFPGARAELSDLKGSVTSYIGASVYWLLKLVLVFYFGMKLFLTGILISFIKKKCISVFSKVSQSITPLLFFCSIHNVTVQF